MRATTSHWVIAIYDRAIKLRPDYSWGFERRGDAFAKKGDTRARSRSNSATRLDPRNRSAFVSRGVIFAKSGDHDRAIQGSQSGVTELDPKNGIAFGWRASSYEQKGIPTVRFATSTRQSGSILRMMSAFTNAAASTLRKANTTTPLSISMNSSCGIQKLTTRLRRAELRIIAKAISPRRCRTMIGPSSSSRGLTVCSSCIAAPPSPRWGRISRPRHPGL